MDGWDHTEEWEFEKDFTPKTKVSVVIAARNEEKSIGSCLNSILQCHYPSHLLEVIVVNDHSQDATEEVVNALSAQHPISLINLDKASGKKNALTKGIEQASGDLIACTDADCLVNKDWLKMFVSYFESHQPNCVAGPISYLCDDTLIQRFQYLDAINNMCVTANGIKKQTYYMANGANLFFTKASFKKVGGYARENHLASGDDMFLIQKIAKYNPNKVAFLKSQNAIVHTQPELTLNALKDQRTRWATKTKAYTNKKIMMIQGFVFCFVILILLNLPLSLMGSGLSIFGFLFALFVKWAMDYLYLSKLSNFFGDRKPVKSFFPASLAFIVYILFAGWKAIRPTKYEWKGRKVK